MAQNAGGLFGSVVVAGGAFSLQRLKQNGNLFLILSFPPSQPHGCYVGFAGDGDAMALPRPALQKSPAWAHRQAGALQHRRIFFFCQVWGRLGRISSACIWNCLLAVVPGGKGKGRVRELALFQRFSDRDLGGIPRKAGSCKARAADQGEKGAPRCCCLLWFVMREASSGVFPG